MHTRPALAVARDPNGTERVRVGPATCGGHRRLLGWLAGFGRWPGSAWRVPASTAPGWPATCGERGWRWSRSTAPNRQARTLASKSGPLDAIEAARAALSGRACGAAKTRDGNVGAIRALIVAKRSARSTKIKTLNQIRHLSFTAPDQLRQRLKEVSRRQLAARAAALRPGQREGPTMASMTPTSVGPITHRRQSRPFVWEGGAVLAYKEADGTFRSVTRQILSDAGHGQGTSLRYFEVGPGGHTTLEHHEHTHVVIPIRGRGSALVVDRIVPLALHDVVFVPSWGWHQFRAAADEPLGFLCAVRVDRDRPVLPTGEDLAALRRDPRVAAFIRL